MIEEGPSDKEKKEREIKGRVKVPLLLPLVALLVKYGCSLPSSN